MPHSMTIATEISYRIPMICNNCEKHVNHCPSLTCRGKKPTYQVLLHPAETLHIIFDFETTGINVHQDEITQMTMRMHYEDHPPEEFSTFVRTDRPIPPRVVELNGITNNFLRAFPTVEECFARLGDCVNQFLDKPVAAASIRNVVWVAHNNFRFDSHFLSRYFAHLGHRVSATLHHYYADTLVLAKKVLRPQETPNHKLATLYRHLFPGTDPTLNFHLSDVDTMALQKLWFHPRFSDHHYAFLQIKESSEHAQNSRLRS